MSDLGKGRTKLVVFAGLPGGGKSTTARFLSENLKGSTELIVSEAYRQELGLQNPFSSSFRSSLQGRLAELVGESRERGTEWIVLDSNLLEKGARRRILDAAPGAIYIAIVPHAPLSTIGPRVESKFGVGYMYPLGQFSGEAVIDHSLSTGDAITSDEALEAFDVVVQLMTNTGDIRSWARSDGVRPILSYLAALLGGFEARELGSVGTPSDLRLLADEDRWMSDPEVDGFVARAPDRPSTFHRRRLDRPNLPVDGQRTIVTSVLDYSASYIGGLRSLVGSTQLIVPSVRIVAIDSRNQVLLVRRRDIEQWRLPGGSQELNESVESTARRELKEETGLDAASIDLASVRSGSAQVSVDPFGNCNQGLVFTFKGTGLSGSVVKSTSETTDARWFPLDELPSMPERHRRSFEDGLAFRGVPLVD